MDPGEGAVPPVPEEEDYSSDDGDGVNDPDRPGLPDEGAMGAEAEALRDLSSEETEKLVQLRDMIGIDDVAVCRALLESKGWDLEATAREQLGITDGHREEEQRRIERPIRTPPPAPDLRVVRPGNRASEAPGGIFGSLLNWGIYLLTFPVTIPFRIVQSMYGVLAQVLGLRAVAGPDSSSRRGLNGNNPALNPQEDVRRFREDFARNYGGSQNRTPAFRASTYSQALEEAKRDLRFLLVYLHCDDHQDTTPFCRDTLSSDAFLDFAEANQLLLWGCSVDSGEGARVSQAMRESTYPFLAVIVLRQNRMMMVGRVEGACPPAALTARLEEIIRDNEAYVVAARVDREERNMTQTIRAEQDAAFQETLRQDQEKERRRKEAEDEKRRQEEEERRLAREEQERKDRIRQLKVDLVNRIPDEPDASHPDVLRILIKLPGGQRLERRFLPSQSLADLYHFVFCHPDSPDEFDITTNFPKKVLRCKPEDGPSSFEEAGIGQSTMLFVHDLEA